MKNIKQVVLPMFITISLLAQVNLNVQYWSRTQTQEYYFSNLFIHSDV
jgi:hypothetical protein